MQTSMFVAVQSWILMKLSFLFDTDRSPLYREVWDLKRKNDQLTKKLADASQLLQALQADNEILVGCLEYVKGERDRWFHQCLETSSQLKDTEKRIRKLEQQALQDPLTGLLNRTGMIEAWERAASYLSRSQKKEACVICIDADGLKRINDSLGHAAGDVLLKNIAKAMNDSVRQGDIVTRLGGGADEFVIVLPEATVEATQQISRRIQEKLQQQLHETRITASLSIGITAISIQGETLVQALERADRALYESKKIRNTITVI